MTVKRCKSRDDPNRCQGTGAHGGQCMNLGERGQDLCAVCGREPECKDTSTWLADHFASRLKLKCEPGEEIKLLRENLVTINAMIAARLKMVNSPKELLAHAGPVSTMLVQAEKITASLVKIEREADELLDKAALIRWGQRICQAVAGQIENKFEGWEDAVIELSEKVGDIIMEASNKNE